MADEDQPGHDKAGEIRDLADGQALGHDLKGIGRFALSGVLFKTVFYSPNFACQARLQIAQACWRQVK
jgi:hypothetical protein